MNTENEKRALDQNIADAIRACAAAIGNAVITGRITCVHCMHFTAQETCALAGMRPPATVIAFGCNQFDPKIPF